MKMTFRWYGSDDYITLSEIRQIPLMSGVVSSLYNIKPGIVWNLEDIIRLKSKIESSGLEFEVVESVPVHEDIKLGADTRDVLIANYAKTIRNLGKAGVKVICYNFMPVFDWMRSNLNKLHSDGSSSLAYVDEDVEKLNPLTVIDEIELPAWDKSISKQRLIELIKIYRDYDDEEFFNNLVYFIERIIPVAEEVGIKMAIHPDDPPWSIFGLPRIIGNEENLRRFLDIYDSPSNGVTFCTGSLGCSSTNDLIKLIHILKGRIPFAHLRNVSITAHKAFEESAHPSSCGSVDMYEVVKALYNTGFDGYIRPDHGRAIWGEKDKNGYGLYDRALGAMYLQGLYEAIEKGEKKC